MKSLSIVMPAWNEEKRIGPTLEAYAKYFNKVSKEEKFEYEIFVVINNTQDKTEDLVLKAQKKYSSIKFINIPTAGKGNAVNVGFRHAIDVGFDNVGFVDVDMATTPEEFFSLYKRMKGADGVIGSRYVKGANVSPKQTIQRIIASRIFNTLIRALLFMPYRDTQCGAKIFNCSAMEKILPHVTMSKWAFDVEFLYLLRKNGFYVREVPTVWSEKDYTTINFLSSGPKMALGVVRLRLLHSPFASIMRIYDLIVRYIGVMH